MPKMDAKLKASREEAAYRIYLRKGGVQEVMDALQLKRAMAYRLVQAAKKRAAEEVRELEGKEGVAHQFAILLHVQREALEGYERSKAVRKKNKTSRERATYDKGEGEGTTVGAAGKIKQETAEEELIGDTRFLGVLLDSTKEIRELIGLDPVEVKRILVTDVTLTAAEKVNYDTMPTEELMRQIRATTAGA